MLIDFTPDPTIYPFRSRWFESSAGLDVVEVADAGHFVPEHAPGQIVQAIATRF
ncbi:MAG: hypothetical protein WAV90_06120 [Gordonia amarae]